MNEYEIGFAERTEKRATDAGDSMDKYLEKVVRVVLAYIDAAKITGKSGIEYVNCRFKVGRWGVWIHTPDMKAPRMRLYYGHKRLARLDFYENCHSKRKEVGNKTIIRHWKKFVVEVVKLNPDPKSLFYITTLVEEIDKCLTEMNAMISRVLP